MVSSTNLMLLNPYPYYSTAYGSFLFIIRSNSDLYKSYYFTHFQNAWNDRELNEHIDDNKDLAKQKIEYFIKGNNFHGRLIIPHNYQQNNLLKKLEQI